MEFWCMNYSGGSIELDEDVVIRRLRRMCEMKCLYYEGKLFHLTTQMYINKNRWMLNVKLSHLILSFVYMLPSGHI